MRYRYIALTHHAADDQGDAERGLRDKASDLSLELRLRIEGAILFTTKETPTLALPGGCVLLGDLYDHTGRQVQSAGGIPHFPTQHGLRQHLLACYWGEYILIQPGEGDSNAVTFMRDPSGGIACAYSVKPGFLTSDLSIASHLGLYRPQIDWEFLSHCLIYPHTKLARTGLSGICELLPGCLLTVTDRATRTHLAWSPWRVVASAERQRDPARASQAIHRTVNTVVRTLAETDGSLALQLSGGLDSSILGVALTRAHARIVACTAVSPLPGADERRYARQITDLLGIELLQGMLDFSETGIDFKLPKDALRPAVSPLARMAARVMDEKAMSENVAAVYSGGGGDAVFCYLKSAAPAADAFLTQGLKAGWKGMIDLARLHGCTVAKAAQLTLRKLRNSERNFRTADFFLLSKTISKPDLEPHTWLCAPANALPGDRERIFELAGNQLFADVMLRTDTRRVRMPLLSQPVVEACLRIPSWLWISGGQNRAVARSAFSEQLPSEVLHRRSKGNFMNYNAAIYRRNKEPMRRFLLDGCLHAHGLLDADALNIFLDSQLQVRDQSFTRVFDLCMIENWVRQRP